ncbi:SdiA-regulated domain-containing protein [Flavimarina sp. Hel_I_48]|uniref:SdiA-regulated domain-containing protein n=1 Tax=Flavimarina sp. Hel_I_48 TaxID=1392488 RepID=UPI0005688C9E|nr:SdiA-regulated domain-containing protein [Flavimarina sp. Hel_I_48]
MKGIKIISITTLTAVVIITAFTFKGKGNKMPQETQNDYTIHNSWQLPEILNEVSGIVWLSEETMACVQDEDGVIFIYDLKDKKITNKIKFAGPGDYEGIAVRNNNVYVMRSDGTIFEVENFRTKKIKVKKIETRFTSKNNIETLTLDPKTNDLLIAPKDRDFEDGFKGIYRVSIDGHETDAQPFIKIYMNDAAFTSHQKKKIYKTFRPSEVAVHPKTGEYYLLEGKDPKLVILDADGAIKTVHKLDKDTFAQPEGITFDPDGTLYISNESGDNEATILQVSFK